MVLVDRLATDIEDGPVDDVGVGEPHLDGVLLVVDGVNDARHRLVGEGDVAVVADQRLEGERASVRL